jgi:hypothetical protein
MGLIKMLVTQNYDSQQKTRLYADCRSACSTMEAVFLFQKIIFTFLEASVAAAAPSFSAAAFLLPALKQ